MRTIAGQVLAYVAVLLLAAYWIVSSTPQSWSVDIPDAAHTHGVRYHGVDLFLSPAMGWFFEHGLWVAVGCGVVALAVEVVTRRQSRRSAGMGPL